MALDNGQRDRREKLAKSKDLASKRQDREAESVRENDLDDGDGKVTTKDTGLPEHTYMDAKIPVVPEKYRNLAPNAPELIRQHNNINVRDKRTGWRNPDQGNPEESTNPAAV